MKWSYKIGSVAGVEIKVHITFLLLFGWVAMSHLFVGNSLLEATTSLVFLLAVFGFVLLHEFGHSLAAKRFGIATRDITLLPIGGVARLERMPDIPRQELITAAAGPAVNLVLALVLYLGIALFGNPSTLEPFALTGGSLLSQLFWVNIFLAGFNLLPAFPTDGGRILRALLAMRMDKVRATNTAASIGKGMALILGTIGLFYSPFLVLIAFFIWIGGSAEAAHLQLKETLNDAHVEQAMIKNPHTLSPTDTMQQAAETFLATHQRDIPVVDQGGLVGVLTREDMFQALADSGPNTRVGQATQPQSVSAEPTESLFTAFGRLVECGCGILPVVEGNRLVGVLTNEKVNRFAMIKSVLQERTTSLAT